jgi:NAD+ kinase
MKHKKLNIKKVGVFLRPNSPEFLTEYLKIENIFKKFNVNVILDKDSALMLGLKNHNFSYSEVCKNSDILISFGGDGTLLSTVRKSFLYKKPILPINGGNLGFLVDLHPNNIEYFIEKLFKNVIFFEERKMLQLEYNNQFYYAFNDIVITSKQAKKMINIYIYTDLGLLNSYYGDGLILSTPTGSTAYNLSAGGSILYPLVEGFILTPISPHSLTQRPIILPSKFEIFIETDSTNSAIIVDGQDNLDFQKGDKIKISISKDGIQIIRDSKYNYFDTLRKKLKWGDEVIYNG